MDISSNAHLLSCSFLTSIAPDVTAVLATLEIRSEAHDLSVCAIMEILDDRLPHDTFDIDITS